MVSLSKPSCLIGHTGFVGGALRRQALYDCCFNSGNFRDMAGQSFGLVVCCGVSAVKWRANQEPEADRAGILALADVLRRVTAEAFVLVSTVDVHPVPAGVDEAADCARQPNHAYGRHRLEFEGFIRERFPRALILRLPGLFGPGLRKNALHDLLHRHQLEAVNPEGRLQWYDVGRLSGDIGRARAAGLPLVQMAVEPVRTGDIAAAVFPEVKLHPGRLPAPCYDMRTRHAGLFGGHDGYIMDRAEVMARIGAWAAAERAALGRPAP